MSQPPNPPSGGTPAQPPGGWNPDPNPSWSSDPTQQLPAGQQYPPTQPLPAGEQYPGQYGQGAGPSGQNPATGQYPGGQNPPGQYPGGQNPPGQYPGGQNPPGQYPAGQNPAPGQYPAGQYGQNPGQYGPAPAGGPYPGGGQYVPPGSGGFGAPPGGAAAPSGGSGGGRNQLPLVIGIIAGVVVLGLLSWFLFLRPNTTASPTPSSAVPSAPVTSVSPSVLITPSAPPSEAPSSSASPQPSSTTSAACAAELSANQCDWAVYLRRFVVVSSCLPDTTDERREAFTCAANTRGKLDGNATVSLRWADDNADLTALMNEFFVRAGVPKSQIGSNWKKPPALTNWWYTDKPKDIIGKLGSADKDNGSGVAWTYKKQRFFAEASSDSDSAETMIDWWAN